MPRKVRVTAIDYEDVKQNYRNLFNSISERASEIADAIDEIDDELDLLEKQKTVDKESFLQAVEFVSNNSREYIKAVFQEAMFHTFEFNYEPYMDHMMMAIEMNSDEMVIIKPFSPESFRDITIEVNLDALGNIEDYANAVEAVRGNLKYPVTSDPIAASRMWKEKIFKTAREGGKVYRRKKSKKGQDGEEGKEIKVDVTEKYIGRYFDTVTQRLDLLEPGKAPYWYLIQHGNTSVSAFEKGGEPYPIVEPFDIEGNIERKLYTAFKEAYGQFVRQVESVLSNKMWGEFGFKGAAPGLKNLEEEVVTGIRHRIAEKEGWEMAPGTVLDIIKEVDRQVVTYVTSAQNIASYARGANGRWVSLTRK